MTAESARPGGGWDKVSYRPLGGGGPHTAYIDTDTGLATEKHSDEPVNLLWDAVLDEWIEI